jgi:hypothetical protein
LQRTIEKLNTQHGRRPVPSITIESSWSKQAAHRPTTKFEDFCYA